MKRVKAFPVGTALAMLLCFIEGVAAEPTHPQPRALQATSKTKLTTGNTAALRKVIVAPSKGALRAPGAFVHSPVVHRPVPMVRGPVPAAIAVRTATTHPGVPGGFVAANALTPFRRAPATPVLGGVPSRLKGGYGIIGGNALPHKP